MKEAYIVKGFRTAVGKAIKGSLRFTRPETMATAVIKKIIEEETPELDKNRIDDVIVGNAMPEAEQGLNMARLISLMGLDTVKVPGVTINRYCASGSETIATTFAKIRMGIADCILAGGVESMSYIPMGGYKAVPHFDTVKKGKEDYYCEMGLTAESVAHEFNVSREDQDSFAFSSHQKALRANKLGIFNQEIVPINVEYTHIKNGKKQTDQYSFAVDEGPRADTSLEALGKLRPVFNAKGSVTAGNSSQMSDGAAFVLIMSEDMVKELNIKPIARLVSYGVVGVEPRIMGIGPVKAIPKALEQANMKLSDIELIELNEAFASQSLAVIRELDMNQEIVNVNGGAIALGHPLGCTGAKLTVQLLNEMTRRKQKYGMVTMCVGTGQGAASIFERL